MPIAPTGSRSIAIINRLRQVQPLPFQFLPILPVAGAGAVVVRRGAGLQASCGVFNTSFISDGGRTDGALVPFFLFSPLGEKMVHRAE
jgi:hypothetical protein